MLKVGARGSVDGRGTMLQEGSSRVSVTIRSMNFFILPNPSRWHHGPGVYSASNSNEYQKIFLGVKRSRRIRLITSLPSVRQLSRQCGILDISQPYRHPWPVTFYMLRADLKDQMLKI
jgi:hypothetical protein